MWLRKKMRWLLTVIEQDDFLLYSDAMNRADRKSSLMMGLPGFVGFRADIYFYTACILISVELFQK